MRSAARSPQQWNYPVSKPASVAFLVTTTVMTVSAIRRQLVGNAEQREQRIDAAQRISHTEQQDAAAPLTTTKHRPTRRTPAPDSQFAQLP